MNGKPTVWHRAAALGCATLLLVALAGLPACSGSAADAGADGGAADAGADGGAGAGAAGGADSGSDAGGAAGAAPGEGANRAPATAEGSDLVIPIADISEQARFYPTTVDGTALEVLAIRAPDGSIRTAFNTCQVCYDSGRGYYEQEGSVLVCQNCGNRFAPGDVEIQTGGCNPVPIFETDKLITDDTITIPASYLKEASDIFANWKR
ncbi:MAG: DUF2318 domain-containing protein [Coriobacteriales bacterium]|jgi:hypothetical protein|nr:DUF2318 domain-containing protein [Coriobacteriales bacterium]